VQPKFDPKDIQLVLEQWINAAKEKIDLLIDNPTSSVIDVRDCKLWLGGCLNGAFQTLGVPIPEVNRCCNDFLVALDLHLMDRMPETPPSMWHHNVPRLQ
jgi:hypothetical protein